jgi:hypothetical protein
VAALSGLCRDVNVRHAAVPCTRVGTYWPTRSDVPCHRDARRVDGELWRSRRLIQANGLKFVSFQCGCQLHTGVHACLRALGDLAEGWLSRRSLAPTVCGGFANNSVSLSPNGCGCGLADALLLDDPHKLGARLQVLFLPESRLSPDPTTMAGTLPPFPPSYMGNLGSPVILRCKKNLAARQ